MKARQRSTLSVKRVPSQPHVLRQGTRKVFASEFPRKNFFRLYHYGRGNGVGRGRGAGMGWAV